MMKLLIIYFIINAILHIVFTILGYFDEDSEIRYLIDHHGEIYDTKLGWICVMILGTLIGLTTALPQFIGLIIYCLIQKVKEIIAP